VTYNLVKILLLYIPSISYFFRPEGEQREGRDAERESEERKTFTKESSMNRCASYFTYEPWMVMTS